MKQSLNNDGNAMKDSNANTDASNKPQVNNMYYFCFFLFVFAFNMLPHISCTFENALV